MINKPTKRSTQIEGFLSHDELLEATGLRGDPLYGDLMPAAIASPLQNGKISAHASALTQNILGPMAIAKSLFSPVACAWPRYRKDDSFCVGFDAQTGEAIRIPWAHFLRHFLVAGSTGAGKSTLIRRMIYELFKRKIPVLFMDYKGDGSLFLNLFPDVLIVNASQIYENLINPIGDPISYFTSFCAILGKRYALHPGTEAKLVEILRDMYEGAPGFSLKDFERTVKKLADLRSDSTLTTGCRAIAAFNRLLGRTAYVRGGPGVDCGRWPFIIIECVGEDPDFLSAFSAIRLLRFMLRAKEKGHSGGTSINSVYVSDEGQFEWGRQSQSKSGSNRLSAPERMITQLRSLGRLIIVGVQHVSKVMSFLPANVGSFLGFGAKTQDDIRWYATLLGMKSQKERETLINVPPYHAFFKCDLHHEYRLVRLIDMPAGPVPDESEVERRMRPHIEWLEQHSLFSPEMTSRREPIKFKEFLGEENPVTCNEDPPPIFEDHVLFMNEIIAHPDDAVNIHYKRIGWSATKGGRVKSELQAHGFILCEKRKTGGKPADIWSVTSDGQEYLDGLSEHK